MPQLRMKPILAPVALLAVIGMLAGCAPRHSVTVGAVPDDYRTRHPIVLAEREEVLDLPVGLNSYRMTWQQRAAIEGFLDKYGDSGGALVTILVPDGSANAAAARGAADDFRSLIHGAGVPKGHVQVLSYQSGAVEAAPVRLSYPLVKATVGQCGRWPEDLMQTEENRNYANFGCAYQSNLAAQVANPTDFLGPRKATSIDAENRDVAIGIYKAGGVSDRFISASEVEYD